MSKHPEAREKTRRKRFRAPLIAGILFALVFALLPPAGGQAAETGFSFALDRNSAEAGDTVKLNVSAQGGAKDAAGFRLRVSYDEDVLRFLGTETTGPTNGTLRTNSSSNPIYSVYVCSVGSGSAPELSGKIATFVFQVKDGAEAGSAQFSAQADQICDFGGNKIDADCTGSASLDVTVPSDEALLTGLVPSQGMLQPAFSPDRTDYGLSVGANVSSVAFQADAASGGTVKISRKSLSAAGSDTQIVVTVTSANKSVQRQYFILVSRAAKAVSSSAPESAPEIKNNPPSAQAGGKTAIKSGARTASGEAEIKPSASEGEAPSIPAGASSGQTEAAGRASSAEQERAIAAQTRETSPPAALNVVQNRMPAYFAGMFACAFCISAGVAAYLWLSAKPKGK